MKFLSIGSFLALSGLAAAGSLHHGGASSYSTVVNHGDGYHGHGWSRHGGAGYGGHGGVSYSHGSAGYDYHSYPQYQFEYGVQDSKTGDNKNQWEQRDGDNVKGSYTLKEADGTTRVVDYHADGHHGFNAVVKKLGQANHAESYHSHGGWKGAYGGHGYGHATSYAKVNLH
uniref:Cuticle protein n=1 Tax=Musca domestica TaxID=7370 RepID=A0A1I8MS89_MUSDO